MFDKLFEYFTLNERADLPGIGAFTIENTPAKLDFVNKTLYPSSSTIRFQSGFGETDKNFYSFLSNNWSDNDLENIRHFNAYIFDIKNKLSSNTETSLPYFGTLRKDAADNYSFEQDFSINDFFPPVIAERIIRKGAKHTVKTGDTEYTNAQMQALLSAKEPGKDHWKLYAIILAIIGLVALIIYYTMN